MGGQLARGARHVQARRPLLPDHVRGDGLGFESGQVLVVDIHRGTMAGAAGPVTAILPPGAEDASAAAAAAFVARGAETEAVLAQLTAIRAMFAETVGASGVAYTAMDGINEATLAL